MSLTTQSAVAQRAPNELLLELLEARVKIAGDVGVRLRGTICVGVRRNGRTAWWVAELGAPSRTHFADELPARFDAGVVVDDMTALWIMGASKTKGAMHLTTGDAVLLDAFVRRYLAHTDVLAIRLRGNR